MNSNPFVVQQLRPINPTGQSTATYELTRASTNPTRIIGRDARGFPIEDSIPTAAKWGYFLMPDGCVNKVPLRTGSVPSQHADAIAYENETMQDLLLAGAIPAWVCPYTAKFAYITGGPFVTPPPGEHDCGGVNSEHGCAHLQKVAALRKAEVRRVYNLDLERFNAQRDAEYDRMRRELVEGVGEAIARHATPSPQAIRAARADRARDGKSDPGQEG